MAKSSPLPLLLGSVIALLVAGYLAFVYQGGPPNTPQSAATELTSDYVDPATCSGCHADIAASYAETGMAQAFYAATPQAMAHLGAETTFEHRKSGRSFQIVRHDDAYFMRRHETGPDGSPVNVFEKRIDYVMGSGNHARTYIHQYPNGKLIEMPVGWYSENDGFLAMSPGFDASVNADFRRELGFDCIGCHNGLSTVRDRTFKRSEDPLLTGDLSGGIGCQRCHGPGRNHVEAVASGADGDAIRQAIFNPSHASRDRQVEVCMQCHLETTSRRLPYSVARYDRGPFSYAPGEPLQDLILHFDYPKGVKEDRFEIAHAAYRLRKSSCFLNSEMTCTTCHNPHSVVRGEAAKTYFTSACKTCHADSALAQIPNHSNATDCQTCHMPKRRTDDVVHVVMTDHYIQRTLPRGNLLAPLNEITEGTDNVYRGPVEPYYQAQIGSDPEDQLYLAVAQVTQRTNLQAGTEELRELIEQHQPEQADFYFQLAEAYWSQQKLAEALPWYQEAIKRDPQHLIAMRNYATVLAEAGRHSEAEQVARQALEIAPNDPKGLNNLGDILVTLGRATAAIPVLTKSLVGDPDSPEALQNLARAYGETGDTAKAVEAARQAIRVRPDFAIAHNTLANVLVEQRQFAEAEQAFRKALELDPNSAVAHYNYANLLVALERLPAAERHLREALRIAPTMAAGHRNLGNLLGMRGDALGAERLFRRALEIDPNDPESHYNLGNALAAQQRIPDASQSYRRAVELRARYDQARVNLAITLYTLGDETTAREEAAKISDPVLRGRAQQAMVSPQ